MRTPNTPEGSKKRIDLLRRTAKEVKNYRVRMKMLSILLVLLTTFVGVVYVAAVLYEQSGSFTVRVNKYDMQKGSEKHGTKVLSHDHCGL